MHIARGRLLLCLHLLITSCYAALTKATRPAAASSADLAPKEPFTPHPYSDDLDRGESGHYPTHNYLTSEMPLPFTNFLQWSPECDDGLYYFITPKGWSVKTPGPMILDRDGEVVWTQHFDNRFGGQAYNLQVQTYRREPHLTFWLGDDTIVGHGFGYYYVLNSSYDIVHRVGMADGRPADLHECIITQEGTAMIIAYEVVVGDLSPLHPPRTFRDFVLPTTYIWDTIIQEYDLASGNLVFEWRASEHVNISATYRDLHSDAGTQNEPFDWFHANSIYKDDLWNYVISVRYTQAVYYIHGRTREVLWVLGGRQNDFMDISSGHALNFAWQHDAQFVPLDAFPDLYTPRDETKGMTTRLMTLFDNAAEDWNYDYGPPYSRGMLLELTFPAPRPQKPDPMQRGAYQYHEATQDPNKARAKSKGPNSTPNNINPKLKHPPLSSTDAAKYATINGQSPLYTVRLIQEWVHPQNIRSSSQGGLQVLPQGLPGSGLPPKVLVGYGLNAVLTEFASNGTVLCDLHFGAATSWESGHVQSYRAYKFPWVGAPRTAPILALRGGDEAFVSWNGATEVAAWQILVSDTAAEDDEDPSSSRPASPPRHTSTWAQIAVIPKTKFETHFPLSPYILQYQQQPQSQFQSGSRSSLLASNPPATLRYARVVALTATGAPLPNGQSNIVDRGYFTSTFQHRFGARGSRFLHSAAGAFSWLSGTALVLLLVRWAFSRRSKRAGAAGSPSWLRSLWGTGPEEGHIAGGGGLVEQRRTKVV